MPITPYSFPAPRASPHQLLAPTNGTTRPFALRYRRSFQGKLMVDILLIVLEILAAVAPKQAMGWRVATD
jgi:hypothetical protein